MLEQALLFQCRHYSDVSRDELYAALRLRQLVFVVEQHCVYLDVDEHDRKAWHLFGYGDMDDARHLAAYARLFAPGDMYDEASIGRVVTHPHVRGRGHGRALMLEALARVHTLFGAVPTRISAQLYLERFYSSLDFVRVGDPYDEDGIPHVAMRRAYSRHDYRADST